jgi:hypothetical protein
VSAKLRVRLPGWLSYSALACAGLLCHAPPRAFAQQNEAEASINLLDAQNRALAPGRSLGFSRRITHDRSLSRSLRADAESEDPENFRVELFDANERANVVFARVEALGPDGVYDAVLRHVPLLRVTGQPRFRSPSSVWSPTPPTSPRRTSEVNSCGRGCAAPSAQWSSAKGKRSPAR